MTSRLRKHYHGPGGIGMLLQIAVPMMISHSADTLMLFIDRLFLSKLEHGDVFLSAAMVGGVSSFMMMTLFFGIIGYVNALTAQYLGAKRQDKCAVAATQGMLVALISYPLILLLQPLGVGMMRWAGHSEMQFVLEARYFNILVWGSILGLLRMALSSFFSGIGRTRVVMVANVISMIVNIFANYVLIFGKLGFPKLMIRGAAYGTLIGSLIGLLILFAVYFNHFYRTQFKTAKSLVFDRKTFRSLIYYGSPAGLEFLLNLLAFNLFIQMFHSYGQKYAAALTITFQWDIVAFIPMLGINVATTSLVGRYMGAGEPDLAKHATFSGLKVTGLYASVVMLLFFFIPETLVSIFVNDAATEQGRALIDFARIMLRMAAFYTLADATALVFSAAIRGAGDTRWALKASVTIHWIMTMIGFYMIKIAAVQPVLVWGVFVFNVCVMAVVFFLRFHSGRWQLIRVVDPDAELPDYTGQA